MNMTSCQGLEHSEDTVAMNLGDTVGASVIENGQGSDPLKVRLKLILTEKLL